MPRHIRKGDEVIVTAGNFRGAVGSVVRILTKADRAVVQFPQSVYDGEKRKPRLRSLKPTRINPQGGQVALDRSFHLSNLSPVVDGKPSRVRFPAKKDGAKVRVAARGGKELGTVHGPRERGASAKAAAPVKKKTTTRKKTTAKRSEA